MASPAYHRMTFLRLLEKIIRMSFRTFSGWSQKSLEYHLRQSPNISLIIRRKDREEGQSEKGLGKERHNIGGILSAWCTITLVFYATQVLLLILCQAHRFCIFATISVIYSRAFWGYAIWNKIISHVYSLSLVFLFWKLLVFVFQTFVFIIFGKSWQMAL